MPLRPSVLALLPFSCAAASCTSPVGSLSRSAATAAHATYFHAGFAAGPVAFSDEAGALVEERRHEPYGPAVDARRAHGSAHVIGPPDVATHDLNPLNKRTERVTRWSDHGARWLAPETARWLTPDPPVQGPKDTQLLAPWRLHPYQYVDQNPIAYWDPDGREPVPAADVSGSKEPLRSLDTEIQTLLIRYGRAYAATIRFKEHVERIGAAGNQSLWNAMGTLLSAPEPSLRAIAISVANGRPAIEVQRPSFDHDGHLGRDTLHLRSGMSELETMTAIVEGWVDWNAKASLRPERNKREGSRNPSMRRHELALAP